MDGSRHKAMISMCFLQMVLYLLILYYQVHFETEPRSKYLQLLGFDEAELMKKVTRAMQCEQDASAGVDASELAQKMALLNGKVCSFVDRSLLFVFQVSTLFGCWKFVWLRRQLILIQDSCNY